MSFYSIEPPPPRSNVLKVLMAVGLVMVTFMSLLSTLAPTLESGEKSNQDAASRRKRKSGQRVFKKASVMTSGAGREHVQPANEEASLSVDYEGSFTESTDEPADVVQMRTNTSLPIPVRSAVAVKGNELKTALNVVSKEKVSPKSSGRLEVTTKKVPIVEKATPVKLQREVKSKVEVKARPKVESKVKIGIPTRKPSLDKKIAKPQEKVPEKVFTNSTKSRPVMPIKQQTSQLNQSPIEDESLFDGESINERIQKQIESIKVKHVIFSNPPEQHEFECKATANEERNLQTLTDTEISKMNQKFENRLASPTDEDAQTSDVSIEPTSFPPRPVPLNERSTSSMRPQDLEGSFAKGLITPRQHRTLPRPRRRTPTGNTTSASESDREEPERRRNRDDSPDFSSLERDQDRSSTTGPRRRRRSWNESSQEECEDAGRGHESKWKTTKSKVPVGRVKSRSHSAGECKASSRYDDSLVSLENEVEKAFVTKETSITREVEKRLDLGKKAKDEFPRSDSDYFDEKAEHSVGNFSPMNDTPDAMERDGLLAQTDYTPASSPPHSWIAVSEMYREHNAIVEVETPRLVSPGVSAPRTTAVSERSESKKDTTGHHVSPSPPLQDSATKITGSTRVIAAATKATPKTRGASTQQQPWRATGRATASKGLRSDFQPLPANIQPKSQKSQSRVSMVTPAARAVGRGDNSPAPTSQTPLSLLALAANAHAESKTGMH